MKKEIWINLHYHMYKILLRFCYMHHSVLNGAIGRRSTLQRGQASRWQFMDKINILPSRIVIEGLFLWKPPIPGFDKYYHGHWETFCNSRVWLSSFFPWKPEQQRRIYYLVIPLPLDSSLVYVLYGTKHREPDRFWHLEDTELIWV